MACGNNHVSRGYLSSAPQSPAAALRAIHAQLPTNRSLEGHVYLSTTGQFVDKPDPKRGARQIPDVTTPEKNPDTGKYELRWKHEPDPDRRHNKQKKPYTHLLAPTGNFGPASFTKRLPRHVQTFLGKKRVIVIRPEGFWWDEQEKMRPTVAHGPE